MEQTIAPSPERIGLALGGGSARGWSHIGVIHALADAGIDISCVAGTSIGSLVGGAFARGRLDALEEFVRDLDWRQIISFLDVVFPRSGLIDGAKLTDFFRSHIKGADMRSLRIPFCAVATDLGTGREILLDKGDLIEAIRASISIPGMFTPARMNGSLLVDGGLVNPVPVSAARSLGADYVIAVDLNHDIVETRRPTKAPGHEEAEETPQRSAPAEGSLAQVLAARLQDFGSPALSQVRRWMRKDTGPTIFDVMTSSIDIMEAQITTTKLAADPPELLIRPRLGHIRLMEFNRAEEAIAEGYRATREALEQSPLPSAGGKAPERDGN